MKIEGIGLLARIYIDESVTWHNLIAAPDVPVHLEFFDEDAVVFEAEARFLWAIEGEAAWLPRPSSTPKPAAGGPASPRCWQTAGAPRGMADR